jgi:peptidoglycan/LPS O-acetylase OafA/YrhL
MDISAKTETIYRQDIDGLRAFAVSAVVLFHCGFMAYPVDLQASMYSLLFPVIS